MKTLLIVCLCFIFVSKSFSQELKKSVTANSIENPLKIDGYLNESCYKVGLPAVDFLQLQPYNGKPCYQKNEVYFFYDQTAIYIGAMLYDESPDSIFNYFSARDNIGMSDYFGVYLDPYNEGQLAYGFFITPAGVQTDIKAVKSEWDYEDGNWNAVWESSTCVSDSGWSVEMRIPYSAIRFPENTNQDWGMNMFRNIRRYNSNNSWNFVDREVSGFIHQQGVLKGINNIKPPVRLSLTPYLASYAETNKENSQTNFIYKGGLDLKYGITESFTLDMMVIPDFGQVQSDDKQLNLSPYEIYYDEKRQFFNEGTELFQRGDIFYSRRIGASPKFSDAADDTLTDNEVIEFSASETQLVNATKISGRSKDGWGVGVLNAMSLESNATLKDTLTGLKREIQTQPFTNYNVSIIDKSLKNNSYVSLINTNVKMANHEFHSNVLGTEFQLRDKSKTYAINGGGAISYRNIDDQKTGYKANLELEKNSGKLNFSVEQEVISDDFNANDLGYIQRNNIFSTTGHINYAINDPVWILREWNTHLYLNYSRNYKPWDVMSSSFELSGFARFKNNYTLYANYGQRTTLHDYFESRVDTLFYWEPYFFYTNVNVGTDSRKNLSMYINFGGFNLPTTPQTGYWTHWNVNWRLGQRLQVYYYFHFFREVNDIGFYEKDDDRELVLFSQRMVSHHTNLINLSYAFNNKTSMRLRARYYWSAVDNYQAMILQNEGHLINDYNEKTDDENNTAFNIDMVFRWVFAPGSELSFAWKNAISSENEYVIGNYWKNIQTTFDANQINTISLKILYYLDYNKFIK